MTFEDLEKMVLQWASDRTIFGGSSTHNQYEKLYEEYTELGEAIVDRDTNKMIDAIGDMMVVQTIIAKMIGVDLFTCYSAAYLQIKDRKGKMVDGIFVKES
jgi:NTP pyrophosphatase (non-canonical NTP hydrolase)